MPINHLTAKDYVYEERDYHPRYRSRSKHSRDWGCDGEYGDGHFFFSEKAGRHHGHGHRRYRDEVDADYLDKRRWKWNRNYYALRGYDYYGGWRDGFYYY